MTDLSRARQKPYAHQVEGVERLVATVEPERGRTLPGCFFLADEMRLGKTMQVVCAAQALFEQGLLHTVVVVAPAQVRDVWYDPELGQIAKHHWEGLPVHVREYHSSSREWAADYQEGKPLLRFVITNYEYVRHRVRRVRSGGWRGPYLDPLLAMRPRGTMLVLDESSAVSTYDSLQTRACNELRKRAERVVLLNGTPVVENPEDLFSQLKLMDPRILGTPYITQFRAMYAVMGGHRVQQKVWEPGRGFVKKWVPVEVLGWRHRQREGCCETPPYIATPLHSDGPTLEDLQARVAPYILRRVRKDCLDLPPKLDTVPLTATLEPRTWGVYRQMQEEAVAWLDSQTVSLAQQAGQRAMRLHQITSGFLGGLHDEEAECPECGAAGPGAGDPRPGAGGDASGLNLEREGCPACGGLGVVSAARPPQVVGREKLDVLLGWVKQRMRTDPEMRMLVWCKFRPELERAYQELQAVPKLTTAAIFGGQKKAERREALRLMHPEVSHRGAALLIGTVQTGAQGLDLSGAREVVYMSNDRSLRIRQQSEDRPIGPGQKTAVSYHDIIAVGPRGQRTIDHVILKNLSDKHDLAEWTCSAWVQALRGVPA